MVLRIFTEQELGEIGKTLFHTRRGWLTLDEMREWLEINTIIKLFDTWAVTDYGVECLFEYYPIESKRLREDWIDHLTEKNWMTAAMLRDLTKAIDYAKEHFHIGGPDPG